MDAYTSIQVYIYYKCILVLTFTPYFYYKSHWKLHTVHVLCVMISTFNTSVHPRISVKSYTPEQILLNT